MNDDMFMGAPLAPSDFYHSSLGYVLRVEDNSQMGPRTPWSRVGGEWLAIHFSYTLLSM